jgi:hypothetical protein
VFSAGRLLRAIAFFGLATLVWAQRAEVRPAEPISFPGTSDSNSPVHWWNGTFAVIQSVALPIISFGPGPLGPLKARAVALDSYEHTPMWIEASWTDEDGTIYAWYHHEMPICGGRLSMPAIGALISADGGLTFRDLGIIIDSGYAPDCNAQNGYFGGGHGDFSVLPDHNLQHFYFYFTNYSGPEPSQGIAVGRLAYADREPGLGGRVSAILPAYVTWSRPNADSFWGPSLHWNSAINRYVMLLNRACCEPGWPAEGIYVSFNYDLSAPYGWSQPDKILERGDAGWYPQVVGLEPGMSDKLAGSVARLFVGGDSRWEIVFHP